MKTSEIVIKSLVEVFSHLAGVEFKAKLHSD